MKKPKERRNVIISFVDGSIIRGYIHVDEGLRALDFLNAERNNFVVVTVVEGNDHKNFLLNKATIKWVEDLGKHE